MTIENQVSPDAETQNPAPEVVETPELTTPDADGLEPQEVEPPPLTQAERDAKNSKRSIDRLTARKHKLTEQVEAMQDYLAEQRNPRPDQTREPQFGQDRFDAAVQQRAEQIAQGQTTAKRLDTVNAELKKSAGESYDDFIDDLESAGSAASVFLNTALELDDASKVLTHFVNDRDALDEVLRMSPVRQAAYMGRLSARLENETGKPKVSTAPKPLTPLTSRSTSRQSSPLGDEDMVRQIRQSR